MVMEKISRKEISKKVQLKERVGSGGVAVTGEDLDHVSFFQFKENKVSKTLVVEKGTLTKGSGAKAAPLPCENHVRELRAFFTVVLEPNIHTFSVLSETLPR